MTTNNNKKVVVKLFHGLGNQMLQYAYALYLAEYNKADLYVDSFLLENNLMGKRATKRDLAIEKCFDLDLRKVFPRLGKMSRLLPNFMWVFYHKLRLKRFKQRHKLVLCSQNIDLAPQVYLNLVGNFYVEGMWYSEQFFESIKLLIKEKFNFKTPLGQKNEAVLNLIKQSDSVAIHVRRGDYMSANNKAIYDICSVKYYAAAVNEILKTVVNPTFFIFSDDIVWAKNNLPLGDFKTHYIDWNVAEESYQDMRLMIDCQHVITANSTFSWWAGWLNPNPNKIVIAPQEWYDGYPSATLPRGWIGLYF
jgi:hypothetical protein